MKRFYKIIVWLLILFAISLSIIVIASPYGKSEGFDYRLVKHNVHINASPDSVFRFLGNSNNARKWSVFVHHITPLNADSLPMECPAAAEGVFAKQMKRESYGMKRSLKCNQV